MFFFYYGCSFVMRSRKTLFFEISDALEGERLRDSLTVFNIGYKAYQMSTSVMTRNHLNFTNGIQMPIICLSLADPGEARDCSINSLMINSVTQ